MIGIEFDGLCPAMPWHALHVRALVAPGVSSGPANAPLAATRTTSILSTRCMLFSSRVCYASMSFQMLVAHPTAFWPHWALGPGVSFCSICTTLPSAIRYELTTAIASRSLTQL